MSCARATHKYDRPWRWDVELLLLLTAGWWEAVEMKEWGSQRRQQPQWHRDSAPKDRGEQKADNVRLGSGRYKYSIFISHQHVHGPFMLIIIHTERKGNVAGVFNTHAWNIPPNSNAANSTTLRSQSPQHARSTASGGRLTEFWKKMTILPYETALYHPFWRPSYLSKRMRPVRAIRKSLLLPSDWLILSTRNSFL